MENLALKDRHDKIFFGQNLENLTIVLTGGLTPCMLRDPSCVTHAAMQGEGNKPCAVRIIWSPKIL